MSNHGVYKKLTESDAISVLFWVENVLIAAGEYDFANLTA